MVASLDDSYVAVLGVRTTIDDLGYGFIEGLRRDLLGHQICIDFLRVVEALAHTGEVQLYRLSDWEVRAVQSKRRSLTRGEARGVSLLVPRYVTRFFLIRILIRQSLLHIFDGACRRVLGVKIVFQVHLGATFLEILLVPGWTFFEGQITLLIDSDSDVLALMLPLLILTWAFF